MRMKYFLQINEEKRGPYDEDQIREMLGRGVIPTVTLTLEENGTDERSLNYLPALSGPAKAPPPVAKPYYILQEDETKGPYTIGQLRGMWNMGSITGKTMHCQEGDSEWRPLSTILHQLEPPSAQRPTVTQPSVLAVAARKSRGEIACPHCGSHSVGKVRGLQGIGEVFICATLVLLFLIPGIIYYIYIESVPYCSGCGRRV